MCGIFGYSGPEARPEVLIEGIKRLEYRGYDSWGICLAADDRLWLMRRVGRIGGVDAAALATGLDGFSPLSVRSGIAHTRWATHGAPTEFNAHPHVDCAGRIAVIHNGIIENHAALRASLQSKGHRFNSQTDTEVIPHLLEELLKTESDFPTAFLAAMKLLVGAYGIAALWADTPETVYVARHGSPIVLGVCKSSTLVASDPAALVTHTRELIYLDDEEAAILHPDGFETRTLEGVPVSKRVQQVAFSLQDIERGGFPHFMLKEIVEQPESIHNALRGRIVRAEGTAKLGGVDEELLRKVRRCHIVACGTSWHAGLVGKYLLENLARIPTQVTFGAEFRYGHPVLEQDTLVIAVSQSGETADTLAAVREAKLIGAQTIGICNVVGSSIARECGKGIYIHAGPEIGVASTKAFTSQLVVLSLLAVHMGRMRGMSLRAGLLYLDALERLPAQAEAILGEREKVAQIARKYAKCRDFLFIGRLYEYPTALEGALKLKEVSYVHAEGVQAAEMKHGPIALIEPGVPTVVLATQVEIRDKMLGNAHEILARSGTLIAVAQEGDEEVAGLAHDTIFIPKTLDPLVPILAVIPLQLLAYFIAVERGCDVDKPRNLAKSVTVE
jgi:glucosamine--fructose-6-phosphate aminotransferase (isomerizing)